MRLVEQVSLFPRRNPSSSQYRRDNAWEAGDAFLVGVGVSEAPAWPYFVGSGELGHAPGLYLRKIRLELCPPNPSEFVITASIWAERAVFGT